MADTTDTTNPPLEEWRPVVGYEGLYEVSNFGDVRRATRGMGTHVGRLLRPAWIGRRNDRRLAVRIRASGKAKPKWERVHRLVCAAFHGPAPSPHHIVCHNDSVRSHNEASNLRWDTHKANMMDALRHGGVPSGERHRWAKLTDEQVRNIREIASARPRPTLQSIGDKFGVSRDTIEDIVSGRSWRFVS